MNKDFLTNSVEMAFNNAIRAIETNDLDKAEKLLLYVKNSNVYSDTFGVEYGMLIVYVNSGRYEEAKKQLKYLDEVTRDRGIMNKIREEFSVFLDGVLQENKTILDKKQIANISMEGYNFFNENRLDYSSIEEIVNFMIKYANNNSFFNMIKIEDALEKVKKDEIPIYFFNYIIDRCNTSNDMFLNNDISTTYYDTSFFDYVIQKLDKRYYTNFSNINLIMMFCQYCSNFMIEENDYNYLMSLIFNYLGISNEENIEANSIYDPVKYLISLLDKDTIDQNNAYISLQDTEYLYKIFIDIKYKRFHIDYKFCHYLEKNIILDVARNFKKGDEKILFMMIYRSSDILWEHFFDEEIEVFCSNDMIPGFFKEIILKKSGDGLIFNYEGNDYDDYIDYMRSFLYVPSSYQSKIEDIYSYYHLIMKNSSKKNIIIKNLINGIDNYLNTSEIVESFFFEEIDGNIIDYTYIVYEILSHIDLSQFFEESLSYSKTLFFTPDLNPFVKNNYSYLKGPLREYPILNRFGNIIYGENEASILTRLVSLMNNYVIILNDLNPVDLKSDYQIEYKFFNNCIGYKYYVLDMENILPNKVKYYKKLDMILLEFDKFNGEKGKEIMVLIELFHHYTNYKYIDQKQINQDIIDFYESKDKYSKEGSLYNTISYLYKFVKDKE